MECCPDNGEKIGGSTGPLKEYVPAWIADEVRPRVTATLEEIHERAPNAKIVLMGYPQLITNVPDDVSCVAGVDDQEIDWLSSVADVLAQEMGSAATDAGAYVKFSDPRANFRGKGVCGYPEQIHNVVMDKAEADNEGDLEPSQQSFHPKIGGHRLYADSLEQTLDSFIG